MNEYRKNVYRMAWRNRGSIFGSVLIIAIGIFIMVSMLDTLKNLQDRILNYYEESRLADVFVSVKGITTEELSSLENLQGIKKASGKLAADVRMLTGNQEEIVSLHLMSYDEEDSVNRIRLYSSMTDENSIFIGRRMAETYHFAIGQEIKIIYDGRPYTCKYAGICDSPDYIYSIPPSGSMVPDGEIYDIACVSIPEMEKITSLKNIRTELGFLLSPGYSYEDIKYDLTKELQKNGLLSMSERAKQGSYDMVNGEMEELISMGTILPLLFLTISVFMTYVVNKKQISREHALIGTMKAFGMTDSELISSYLIQGGVSGALGGILGMLPAAAFGKFMFGMYIDFFTLSDSVYHSYAGSRAAGMILSVLTGVIAARYSVKDITKIAPAQAMRPETPVYSPGVFSSRLDLKRLKPFDRLALRSMLRHPLRGILIMIAIAFPFSLMPLLLSFPNIADRMFIDQFSRIQVYDLQLSLDVWQNPVRLEQALEGKKGIKETESIGQTAIRISTGSRSEYGVLYALNSGSSLWKIRDNKGASYDPPENGILLNRRIADKLHVFKGDTVTVRLPQITDKSAELQVEAVIDEAFGSGCYLARKAIPCYFPVPDLANTLIMNVDRNSLRSVKSELLEAPRISKMVDTGKTVKSYSDLMASMIMMIDMFIVLSVVAGIVLIYNVSMISLRERATELGTIMILGGSRKEIGMMLLKEQLAYYLGGILFGIPGGFGVRLLLEKIVVSDSYSIVMNAGTREFILSMIICLFITAAAWTAETFYLRKINLVELLKERES